MARQLLACYLSFQTEDLASWSSSLSARTLFTKFQPEILQVVVPQLLARFFFIPGDICQSCMNYRVTFATPLPNISYLFPSAAGHSTLYLYYSSVLYYLLRVIFVSLYFDFPVDSRDRTLLTVFSIHIFTSVCSHF